MKLIIGKFNVSNKIAYWSIGEKFTPDVAVDDYAIVENKDDFDLVKIIGIVETNEEHSKELNSYREIKEAVDYISSISIDNFKIRKKENNYKVFEQLKNV